MVEYRAIPAICENGHVFDTGINIAVGGTMEQHGTVIAQCACGATATIPNGVYSVLPDSISALADNPDAEHKIRAIIQVLQRAQAGETTPVQALEEVREVAPHFVESALDALGSRRGVAAMALLSLLLAILFGVLSQINTGAELSPAQVERIVEQSVRAAESHGGDRATGSRDRPTPTSHQRHHPHDRP